MRESKSLDTIAPMNKTSLGTAILSILVFSVGCGTEEYERRMRNSLDTSSSNSKFSAALEPETTIAGTKVSLRIPKGMKPVDINDAVRGKCPPSLLEMQNLKATYEGFIEDRDKNKMHYYLYVGVSETAPNNITPLQSWLNVLKTNFPATADAGSSEVNKSYSASSPEGNAVPWEEIHFKCPQKFYYIKPDNSLINQDIPGTIVCLCHSENGAVVTLVFRYWSELETRHSTDFDSDWIKLIAGCVKVGS
jgi:hypothetical protein